MCKDRKTLSFLKATHGDVDYELVFGPERETKPAVDEEATALELMRERLIGRGSYGGDRQVKLWVEVRVRLGRLRVEGT